MDPECDACKQIEALVGDSLRDGIHLKMQNGESALHTNIPVLITINA